MRSKLASFWIRHREAIVGSLVGTIVVGSLQVLIGSAVFMLLAGVVHSSLSDNINPLGYLDSLFIITLVNFLTVTVRVGIDYRAVFDEKYTDV